GLHKRNKNGGGFYYTFAFLDKEDNAYNLFVSEEMYNYISRQNFRKFEEIQVTIHIYKQTDKPGYNFSPIAVEKSVFTEDNRNLADKQNPDNKAKGKTA
ncbi:MAG: hypothetical protein HDT39_13755, partial [Lachnospiraceae bacterium]|nr:hypothetical protein [Lachnospiraceae bacterium]